MLNRYEWCSINRISPEAPVPVVRVERTTYVPGGAANVAANVAALGGQVEVVGAIGADEAGCELRRLLESLGVAAGGLMPVAGRPTTTKTRYVAHNQQVLRA